MQLVAKWFQSFAYDLKKAVCAKFAPRNSARTGRINHNHLLNINKLRMIASGHLELQILLLQIADVLLSLLAQ